MTSTLVHRGPDDGDVWVSSDGAIGLGVRRLAVVDLSPTGHQPMHSGSGRTVIAFNGEIYNHVELRRRLESEGVTFRGGSDTEILIEAIERWGVDDALRDCIGMYAFAVWDMERQRLTLACDRMGEKPLYYGWAGSTFVFGSELKALRTHVEFDDEIDRVALAEFFRQGFISAPKSIFEKIRKVSPGTYLDIDLRSHDIDVVEYWSLEQVARTGIQDPLAVDLRDATRELDRLLGRSVELQMMADVPVGAFLSGGIDSSTIVALMQGHSREPVRTFTIGFEDAAYDEAPYARKVADHLGTDHTEMYASSRDCRALIPELSSVFDEPFADSSQIPTMLVSRLARQSVTVSLSGDGGDELFGGYDRYRLAGPLQAVSDYVPFPIRRVISDSGVARLASRPGSFGGSGRAERFEKFRRGLKVASGDDVYSSLVHIWRHPGSVVLGDQETGDLSITDREWLKPLHRAMLADGQTYLPGDLLTKVDRASMRHSLESRIPMLDHRVVEFAWRLPTDLKINHRRNKIVLRELLSHYVPPTLTARSKAGFGVPIGAWLRGPLREWAEDQLDPQRVEDRQLLDPEVVQSVWREHIAGQADRHHEVWAILMFQSWLESA